MSIFCRIFSPRKHNPLCNMFSFSHLIQTSIHAQKTIKEDNNITSVVESLNKGLNWKTLTEKFISVEFSKPMVETILLQLKEPINSRKALKFFHWASKEMHLQHETSSYCITLHILVKARLINDAKALLQSVLTNKDSPGNNNQSFLVLRSLIDSYVVVDSVPFVFDFFIRTCAKLRMIDGVLDSCKLLFDHGFSLSLTSFNTLLHVIQKSNTTHLVWGVYEHMLRTNVYPNEATLRIMVSALCKEGRLDKFVDIVAKMHGKRCSITVVIVNTCLLYGMIEEKKTEDGLVLLKQLLQKNMILDTVSYSLVIFAKVKMGNLDEAKETHEEMLKRGFEKNAFLYSVFIGKYCEEGRINEAVELLEEMKMFSLRPLDKTYNQLIESCATNGPSEDSLKFCKQMIELSLLPSCTTVNKMFERLCESGNSKQADEMLTVLLDKGFTPDESMYSLLIHGYGKEGDLEGAMKVLYEMEYRSISPNMLGFSSLIIILCKHGRVKEAEKYLKTIKAQSFVPNPSVYDSLIVAHLQKGDKMRANQLQCEMFGIGLNTDKCQVGPSLIHSS